MNHINDLFIVQFKGLENIIPLVILSVRSKITLFFKFNSMEVLILPNQYSLVLLLFRNSTEVPLKTLDPGYVYSDIYFFTWLTLVDLEKGFYIFVS